jgi:glycine/D-amino acid oxidase-like deaminating enzyme
VDSPGSSIPRSATLPAGGPHTGYRAGATGDHHHSATCLYTSTPLHLYTSTPLHPDPDRDLVLGPLAGHDRILVALGAAHGFKFAPLVGRALADLACTTGPTWTSARSPRTVPALTSLQPEASYLV